MSRVVWSVGFAALVALAPSAVGATASIDEIGGPVTLRSTRVGNVFTSSSPTFSEADLQTLRNDIEMDLGMGATDGLVTFLLIDSAEDGLAFVTLVDAPASVAAAIGPEDMKGRGGADTSLQLATDGPTSATPFINDEMFDLTDDATTGGRRVIGGEWMWNSGFEGDGFAWADLASGDVLSFAFTEADDTFPGLDAVDTFRFLSFEEGAWSEVARRSFTDRQQFGFTLVVNVIPTPLASVMGLAGLAFAAVRRRRFA